MESDFYLVQQSINGSVSAFRLKEGDNFVGRFLGCEVCNRDESISRRHARIEVRSEKVTIHDLKSKNGTFIDNQQVQSAQLIPNQEVRFGGIRYRLTSRASEAEDVETIGLDDVEIQRALKHPRVAELSDAEKRVYVQLLTGKTEQEIAVLLHRAKHTIHNHAKRINVVFGTHSRAELIRKALSGE